MNLDNMTDSGSGTFFLNQGNTLPQRKGKQFATEEDCLKENGEHIWSEPFDPNPSKNCLVIHQDGHCSWHDPKRICYHCPAEQTLQITQREKKEWI